MSKSVLLRCFTTVLAASLLMLPAAAQNQTANQQPASPAAGTAPQANAPAQNSPQANAPQPSSSSQSQTSSASQPASTTQPNAASQPAPEWASPVVKPGSENDVNAIGNRKVGHGPEFYSIQTDIAIGKQYAQMVDREAKFVTDPVVNEYVNKVAQNIVRNSDAQVPFTVKVIDSSVVNAFALPGGFFYIDSGLILKADEESELAGVMAHEIGHVCARHGTRDMSKQNMMQIAAIAGSLFIPYSWTGYAIYQGMNFGIPITFLKFSRAYEREADFLGVQYMYKAGYDPNSFISFFEKLEADEKKNPGTIPKIFADHPPTPDRIEAAQQEIATILPPRDSYIVTTSEFDMVKHRLQMIESNQKLNDKNSNKPTLRKRTDQNKPGDTTSPTSSGGDTTTASSGSGSGTDQTSDDSDRPTLKRRTDDPSQQP